MGIPRSPSVYKPDFNLPGVCSQDIEDNAIENRHVGTNEVTLDKLAQDVLDIIEPSITTVNVSTYELLPTDDLLHVTYTLTGQVTITIPSDQSIGSKREITIKDAGNNATNNKIRVETEGNEKIDTLDFYDLDMNLESITLYLKDNNWFNK